MTPRALCKATAWSVQGCLMFHQWEGHDRIPSRPPRVLGTRLSKPDRPDEKWGLWVTTDCTDASGRKNRSEILIYYSREGDLKIVGPDYFNCRRYGDADATGVVQVPFEDD